MLAKQLRQQIKWDEQQSDKQADIRFNKLLAELKANYRKRTYTTLSLNKETIERLEAEGFAVRYNRACGMGDVDSHTITW